MNTRAIQEAEWSDHYIQEAVLLILADGVGPILTVSDITHRLHLDGPYADETVLRALHLLADQGKAVRAGQGLWELSERERLRRHFSRR